MNTVYVASVSGGKDSTAMILHLQNLGVGFIPVFADTGNEHPLTLDYIGRLPEMTGCPPVKVVRQEYPEDLFRRRREYIDQHWLTDGVPMERVERSVRVIRRTGNPFLDLMLLKGRAPSTKRRFCTQELKIFPIHEQVILPLLEQGLGVISCQGIRADESDSRAKMTEREDMGGGFSIWRPLLSWTVDEVIDTHKRRGVPLNPLYLQGFSRVGCFPCIMAQKGEIANIAARFPDQIRRIREWEAKMADAVKRPGLGAFFSSDKTSGKHPRDQPIPGIDAVVRWSRTSRGGRMLQLDFGQYEGCANAWGLCE